MTISRHGSDRSTIDESHAEQLHVGRLPVLAMALIVSCGVASVAYKGYLAKGASDAAKSVCADHNTISGSYRTRLARYSSIEQNP